MTGIFRKPTIFDVDYLANNAREMDVREVFYMSGGNISQGLNSTPGLYENSLVWEVDNKLVCMFGTTPCSQEGHYVVWLLATNYFDDHKNVFRKICKNVFQETVKGKKYVYNYVYAGHIKAIKWIKWLGCKVYDPEPMGVNGEMFCKFEVINNV